MAMSNQHLLLLLSRIRIRRKPKGRKFLKRSDKHISRGLSLSAASVSEHDLRIDGDDDDDPEQQFAPSMASSVAEPGYDEYYDREEETLLRSVITSAMVLFAMVVLFSFGKSVSLLLTLSVAMAFKALKYLRCRNRNPNRSDMDDDEEEEEEDEASADVRSLRNLEMYRNRNHQRKQLQRLNCMRLNKFPDGGYGDEVDEEDDASRSYDVLSSLSDGYHSSAENGREASVKDAKPRKMFFKYLQWEEKRISRSTPSSPPSGPAFLAASASEPVSVLLNSRAKNPNLPPPSKLGFQATARLHHMHQRQAAKVRGSLPRSSDSAEKARSNRRLGVRVRVWWMGLCVAMAGLLFGSRIVAIAALSCFWYCTKLISQ